KLNSMYGERSERLKCSGGPALQCPCAKRPGATSYGARSLVTCVGTPESPPGPLRGTQALPVCIPALKILLQRIERICGNRESAVSSNVPGELTDGVWAPVLYDEPLLPLAPLTTRSGSERPVRSSWKNWREQP